MKPDEKSQAETAENSEASKIAVEAGKRAYREYLHRYNNPEAPEKELMDRSTDPDTERILRHAVEASKCGYRDYIERTKKPDPPLITQAMISEITELQRESHTKAFTLRSLLDAGAQVEDGEQTICTPMDDLASDHSEFRSWTSAGIDMVMNRKPIMKGDGHHAASPGDSLAQIFKCFDYNLHLGRTWASGAALFMRANEANIEILKERLGTLRQLEWALKCAGLDAGEVGEYEGTIMAAALKVWQKYRGSLTPVEGFLIDQIRLCADGPLTPEAIQQDLDAMKEEFEEMIADAQDAFDRYPDRMKPLTGLTAVEPKRAESDAG